MRHERRTPTTAAIALFLTLAVMFAGPVVGILQSVAMAATTTGVTVTFSSPASGTQTFDAAGNGSSANDILVLPGSQVTLTAQFTNPAVSDRAHFREDGSGLSIDANTSTAPIVWGWNSSSSPYVLGVFPQNPAGGDLAEPIYVRVYSISPILTATPNEVVAYGPSVQIQAAFVPAATASYDFRPFSPSNTFAIPSTQPGIPVQYTEPGRYVPTVDFKNAQGTVIATATSNAVIVKAANPAIQCDRNNPQIGQEFQCVLTGVDYQDGANFKWGWTDQNGAHEFNSANAYRAGQQASPNTFSWTASQAFDFDLTVVAEFTDGAVFFEVGRATTHIDVQDGPQLNPTVSITMPTTAKENQQISIVLQAVDVTDGEYAINLTGLPGGSAYNPVSDPSVIKVRSGNTVSMTVPFAFSPTGAYTVKASLDVVKNGSWVSGVSTAQAPITITANVGPTPTITPTIDLKFNNATLNVTTTLQIDVTGIGSAERAVRLLGLPTGEYNVTLAASRGEVVVTDIPGGKSYAVPFKFSEVGTFALIARLDVVIDGAWVNNAALDQGTLKVTPNMIYLSVIRTPPTALSVTVTPAQPVVPKTVTLKVNEINGYSFHGPVSNPDADQVIWKVERQEGANWIPVLQYNSTVGANAGEQPNALQVTFWPQRAGTYRYSVHIDRVVANAWTTTAEASGSYTVLEK